MKLKVNGRPVVDQTTRPMTPATTPEVTPMWTVLPGLALVMMRKEKIVG